MVYTRRRTNYKSRYPNRRRYPYRRPAPFISRGLAVKRRNQVATKTFYFKQNGTVLPSAPGSYNIWQIRDIIVNPPTGFEELAKLYDQYKILAMKLVLFACNIGSESADPNPPTVAPSFWARGNTVVWVDQRTPTTPPYVNSISDIINFASAKMIPARKSQYTRTIYRPRGQPLWAHLDSTAGAPEEDGWKGSIQLKNEGASFLPPAGNRPLYYYTVCYKVHVRGRVQQ